MPDRLSSHAPLIVNTVGHCAGAIVFGIFLYLFVAGWRRGARTGAPLPAIAAGLALLWNLGSLMGLATQERATSADAVVAGSYSVLSLLPAVLLHIALGAHGRIIWKTGYVVSVAAVALHVGEVWNPRLHYAAILVITIGFGVLTAIALVREASKKDGGGTRLAGAMVLFLFAISFAHFRQERNLGGWSGEAALHHAGLPLALFVLLQDYRFLLLDAFIRFLSNALLAAAAVGIGIAVEARFGVAEQAAEDPFFAGMVFVGACLLLSLFAFARSTMQRVLTRIVFLRENPERALEKLRELGASAASDEVFLRQAVTLIAGYFSAERAELRESDDGPLPRVEWADAAARLHFARGDSRVLLLGPRAGGRRYLSEDIEVLERLTSGVREQVESIRNSEMRSLVAQAELRALQAQINPHFFFNALNTLYGTIARENSRARRLVVRLADLFRYSFAPDRGFVELEEELKIVRAYLEIEELRLGPRLSVEIEIDESTRRVRVPALSIQPLVENAVKHGVAARSGPGFVRLRTACSDGRLEVEVANSGAFGAAESSDAGTGVGLANVRRRLALCYGDRQALVIDGDHETTSVRFSVPVEEHEGAELTAR
jgi:hypothetical protein